MVTGNLKTIWMRSNILALMLVCQLICYPTKGQTLAKQSLFNVQEFGAINDGINLCTRAINDAIEACSQAGGGIVVLSPGKYLCGTIKLKSNVHIKLESGAEIIGTTNLNNYYYPQPPAFMPEARWGKWHRGLIVGEFVTNVFIFGGGTINGNKVFDPTGEERMRGPHSIVLLGCKEIKLEGITILDAANYAIYAQITDSIFIKDVEFKGGWDGVHLRGAPNRDCQDIKIINCRFYTGDDAIAGRYWNNAIISDCIINSSCNGIRIIGPVKHLIVYNCLFYGPGEQPHRSSNRKNMLSGIILQPGAWDKTQGLLDDIYVSNVTMKGVASPITIWLKEGNTAGTITIDKLSATGVYRAALSAESWASAPITNLIIKSTSIVYNFESSLTNTQTTVKPPGVDCRTLPAWGLYLKNIQTANIENFSVSLANTGLIPSILVDSVNNLILTDLKLTGNLNGSEPVILTNVVNKLINNVLNIPSSLNHHQ
jgi:polygalacturonase